MKKNGGGGREEGHKIFDDQNVGSHKLTTDSVFIFFKKTDFQYNFSLCRVYGELVVGVLEFLLQKYVGPQFY